MFVVEIDFFERRDPKRDSVLCRHERIRHGCGAASSRPKSETKRSRPHRMLLLRMVEPHSHHSLHRENEVITRDLNPAGIKVNRHPSTIS
jgi:hypothetical protein